MNNVIELGFFREPSPLRRHPVVLTESIDDEQQYLSKYYQGEHAPDLESSLNHLKKTLKENLKEDWLQPHIDKMHDHFLKNGVNPSSMETVHTHIQNEIPNLNHRQELMKAYNGTQLSTFAKVKNQVRPSKSKDMSHDEVKALSDVGMQPVYGNRVRSDATGKHYHYEDGALHLILESFRSNPKMTANPRLDRDDHDDLKTTHMALKERIGDITPEQKASLDVYTNDSNPFSLYHIAKAKGLPTVTDDEPSSPTSKESVASVEKHTPILEKMISEKSGHNYSPLTVYTGISRHSDLSAKSDLPKDENGHVIFHAPGFVSTSTSEEVAHSFLRGRHSSELGRDTHDVLKLEIPPNYKHGAYIAPHSKHITEKEYLLNRGHKISVDPTPTYIGSDGKLVRQFTGKLLPYTNEGK